MEPTEKYQIALSLIKGIGPRLTRNLIAYLGSVEAVFNEKNSFEKIPGIGPAIACQIRAGINKELMARAEKELEFIHKHQVKPIFFTDAAYPKRLTFCDDAPLMIYVKGNANLDSTKILSIIGTRRPTDTGLSLCEKLIADIAHRHPETLIISGLAYGIDICAHRAALRHNLSTVAVMAHGLDRIYPGTHTHTAREMITQGGLITEFMTGTNPDKPNFVRRNRIVAGLCDAVVVIESAVKGGALITADIAASYGRDVLAYPGRVGDEASGGCNKLIKTNIAALIESVDDLEYALGWESQVNSGKPKQPTLFSSPETPEEKAIMDILLVEKEMNLNLLARSCNLPVGKASATLLDLEFKGLVKSRPGGIFKLNT
ncbi:DNA-processing protein DprA [Alkaliflexus imshenetskii]|uniref:DNA-processing protein DprA n=1 Tax=Alkaliflexus imshenetskii TaxID=286730 RepID=UPI00047C5189|nr:DNA-processing protein DprA [Alkaliflexus imshenetskii]